MNPAVAGTDNEAADIVSDTEDEAPETEDTDDDGPDAEGLDAEKSLDFDRTTIVGFISFEVSAFTLGLPEAFPDGPDPSTAF